MTAVERVARGAALLDEGIAREGRERAENLILKMAAFRYIVLAAIEDGDVLAADQRLAEGIARLAEARTALAPEVAEIRRRLETS